MALEKQTTEEIHKRLSSPERAVELHREAIREGMPFSRYLEAIDPSEKGEQLDAFGRQMREASIITRSNPAAGWWASPASQFFETPAGRALYPEWVARQWRGVMFATPQQKRAIFLSSDSIVGSWEAPYAEAAAPAWNEQFAPAIPLAELVSRTTPIQGEDYRSIYMNYDAEQLHLYRVGESAEIPIATLETSGRAIRLHKYGRGLRSTYEQMRRTRVDKLAWWLRWQALQAEVDKVVAALDVLVNGDGNANTAATVYNLTTLDPAATPGTLSMTAWLKFRMQFSNPYGVSTVLGQIDEIMQLIMLNIGSANIPLVGYDLAGIGNSLSPINTTADGIRYGWTDDAPNDVLIGIDRRFALEQVTEIGSEIRETERFITNQTEVMTMTENAAFAVTDPAAVKILDLETP